MPPRRASSQLRSMCSCVTASMSLAASQSVPPLTTQRQALVFKGPEVKAMDLFLFPALIPPFAADAASQVILFKGKISCTFLGIYAVF